MDMERYPYEAKENQLLFEFYSDVPRGRVKKIVRMKLLSMYSRSFLNLAFGDWDDDSGDLDDMIVTDNKDTDKVLATVAATVFECMERFSDLPVYFEGSTDARIRLYRIKIAVHMKQMNEMVQIMGYVDGRWEIFKKRINYQAFVAWKK